MGKRHRPGLCSMDMNSSGIDVIFKSGSNSTSLSWAAANIHEAVMKLFIKKGTKL